MHKTRRKFSAEESIQIVLDDLRGESSISELCRREGIAESLTTNITCSGCLSHFHSFAVTMSERHSFSKTRLSVSKAVTGYTTRTNALNCFSSALSHPLRCSCFWWSVLLTWNSNCKASRAWIAEGLLEVEDVLKSSEQSNDVPERRLGAVNERANNLYLALVSGKPKDAKEVLQKLDANGELHATSLSTIKRLDLEWRADSLAIHEIANAFWTMRCALDEVHKENGYLKSTFRNSALIIVPEGEEHSFGAQLLTGRLERLNWDVETQINAKYEAVLEAVAARNFTALGLSVGYDQNLLGLADLVREVRMESSNPNMSVLLGGSVFEGCFEQYGFLGADAIFNNCDTALEFFNSLSRKNSVTQGNTNA